MNATEKNVNLSFEITGDWRKQSKQIRKKFPVISIADLRFDKGNEDKMLHRVEKRLKKNRLEVIDIIKEILPNENF